MTSPSELPTTETELDPSECICIIDGVYDGCSVHDSTMRKACEFFTPDYTTSLLSCANCGLKEDRHVRS